MMQIRQLSLIPDDSWEHHQPQLRVIGPRDKRDPSAINTTSNAGWTRELSPFILGPVKLYENHSASNMENGWQFSKVYRSQVLTNGEPSEGWWRWAQNGWAQQRAVRYPMGKGAVPLYSFWDGEHLSYIEARKRIYVPLYASAVVHTRAFASLTKRYDAGENIVLFDYDGYDYVKLGRTLENVLHDSQRKMGHAFVLAMLLTKHPIVSAWL